MHCFWSYNHKLNILVFDIFSKKTNLLDIKNKYKI